MENRIVSLLKELVGINSVNPVVAGGGGEEQIAGYVGQRLAKAGLVPEIQPLAGRRANVVAIAPGTHSPRSVLINAHLDTVGVEGMARPFLLRREDDRLYGRGAYDMKGSVAVMLLLAEYFAVNPPPVDVLFTFVADEEDKSAGMEYLIEKWIPSLPQAPEGAVVMEPTELEIGVGHNGIAHYEIEIEGKAAHGSRPAEGVDAILPLGAALEELNVIQTELRARRADPLWEQGTLHGSFIEGGVGSNIIPPRSRLQWERRTLPDEAPWHLEGELMRVVQAVKELPGSHGVVGREIFSRPAHKIEADAIILKRFQALLSHSKGVGLSYWSDAALCGRAGIPSLLFGPAGHGAHATDEWVSLNSLVRVYEVMRKVIQSL